VDAVELQARCNRGGRVISWFGCMAESISLKPCCTGHYEVTAKRASKTPKSTRVFGQHQEPAKMFRAGLYARVSTHDQQTSAVTDTSHAGVRGEARLDGCTIY
jgi:hypothetical protein